MSVISICVAEGARRPGLRDAVAECYNTLVEWGRVNIVSLSEGFWFLGCPRVNGTYATLLFALMPALMILVGMGVDIAVRCTRNADETGIINFIACNHDLLQIYVVQKGGIRKLCHFLCNGEGNSTMMRMIEPSHGC